MTPPRESLDVRGIAVLLDAIASQDREHLIPCYLATRAQVAVHEDDGDLAHWLQDAVLAIGDRVRLAERQMRDQPEDRRVYQVLPVGEEASV